MGGGLIRNEPIVHDALLQDALSQVEFRNCGWMDYFLKLNGFNENIAFEFAQTLSDGKAMVRGSEVLATEERIAEVTGLPIHGEEYPVSKDARLARAEFTKPRDPPLTIDK